MKQIPARVCKLIDGYLAYEIRGEGQPLVLLHGFSFDMRTWDSQVNTLSEQFQVIRYDLRGFGRSSLPSSAYNHAEDLHTLVKHLALSAPMLVGLSLGANVALSYALEHPREVRGLVLASSGLPGFKWSEPRPPDAAAEVARTRGVDEARRVWLEHPMFASLRRSSEAYARVSDMVQDYSAWHWRNPSLAVQVVLIDRLSLCATPTLVLSGAEDVLGYRQIALTLSREIPDASLHIFPGVGHVINEEDPAGFSSAVIEFGQKVACQKSIPLHAA